MASETTGSSLPRAVLTGVAVAVLVFPFLTAFGILGSLSWWAFVGLFVGLVGVVTVAVLARQRADRADGESVWDAIPGWQYDGRHVESGGLARGEQEKALRQLQQRAEWEQERSE
ncbi:hypothetical protein [Halogranum rubrum]|uniref:Uncharacterized protein n=1 Tax=Halogranum salarium B-1 TaxID=1210908 RepID=J2ZJV5_9EURY|nr:hypothetical protein [Halogranum salarium]EJN61000.1 hypothetical protein HSB1_00410 [Halogranum salarium B-1]